jgi:hypothetical protein
VSRARWLEMLARSMHPRSIALGVFLLEFSIWTDEVGMSDVLKPTRVQLAVMLLSRH